MRAELTTIYFVILTRTAAHLCNYDSSVELINRSHNGIKYGDEQYFMDNTTGVERGCVCMKETCIRKCCPLGQGYDRTKRGCVSLEEEFDPPVHDGLDVKPGFIVTEHFHLLFGITKCLRENNEFRAAVSGHTNEYHLKTDGKLYVTIKKHTPPNLVYGPDKYCMDNFVTESKESNTTTVHLDSLICFVPKKEYNHYALNATCMLISCFFIMLTVAVYAYLPELRTLHGLIMKTYLLCFFVSFLFMGIMQLLLLLVDNIAQVWCTAMTFVIYFSILAAFFWLNVMCFDVWAKFRKFSIVHGVTRSKYIRYLMYCAYAFGMPSLLTILLAALEFADLPENIVVRPHLRRKGCFIHGMSKLLYLYLPIIILCITNLVFFILTAIKIAETKKQTQVLRRKDTQRLSLYIKLFIVTGINWILEVVSSFYPEIPYLWQFTDAYNVLVGLIVFIIFVCKKKILMSIKRRYNQLQGMPQSGTDTNTTSSSRHQSHSVEDMQMQSNASLRSTTEHQYKDQGV